MTFFIKNYIKIWDQGFSKLFLFFVNFYFILIYIINVYILKAVFFIIMYLTIINNLSSIINNLSPIINNLLTIINKEVEKVTTIYKLQFTHIS